MTRVLACDLDGTLLDEHHNIDSKSLKKIKQFCKEEHIFIVATGRLDHDIVYIEKELGFSGQYRMSQNGAIIRNHAGEIIEYKTIDTQSIVQISDFLQGLHLRVEASTADNRYFPSPRAEGAVAEYHDSSIILTNFYQDIKKLHICTFLIFGTEADFAPIREYLKNNLAEKVDGFMTSPVSFEIVAKGINKGWALQKLLEKLYTQKDVSLTAAIGDAENDASMFPIVDQSFVMEHAKAAVKKQAKHVVQTVGQCVDILLLEEE